MSFVREEEKCKIRKESRRRFRELSARIGNAPDRDKAERREMDRPPRPRKRAGPFVPLGDERIFRNCVIRRRELAEDEGPGHGGAWPSAPDMAKPYYLCAGKDMPVGDSVDAADADVDVDVDVGGPEGFCGGEGGAVRSRPDGAGHFAGKAARKWTIELYGCMADVHAKKAWAGHSQGAYHTQGRLDNECKSGNMQDEAGRAGPWDCGRAEVFGKPKGENISRLKEQAEDKEEYALIPRARLWRREIEEYPLEKEIPSDLMVREFIAKISEAKASEGVGQRNIANDAYYITGGFAGRSRAMTLSMIKSLAAGRRRRVFECAMSDYVGKCLHQIAKEESRALHHARRAHVLLKQVGYNTPRAQVFAVSTREYVVRKRRIVGLLWKIMHSLFGISVLVKEDGEYLETCYRSISP